MAVYSRFETKEDELEFETGEIFEGRFQIYFPGPILPDSELDGFWALLALSSSNSGRVGAEQSQSSMDVLKPFKSWVRRKDGTWQKADWLEILETFQAIIFVQVSTSCIQIKLLGWVANSTTRKIITLQ